MTSDDTMTLEKLRAACRVIPTASPAPRIFVSHILPERHVGEHIYPAHPIARVICRWLGMSPWVHLPMYRTDAVMIGGDLFVTPAQFDAMKARQT